MGCLERKGELVSRPWLLRIRHKKGREEDNHYEDHVWEGLGKTSAFKQTLCP